MAQDTVDVLSRRDGRALIRPTQRLPLYGSSGWPSVQQEIETKGASLGLPPAVLKHLGWAYGSEALRILQLIADDARLGEQLIGDLPYVYAEVLHACRAEMALTPYDILARRTSITLEDTRRGLGIVAEVAALMAQELAWSPEYEKQMVGEYREAIEEQIEAERA